MLMSQAVYVAFCESFDGSFQRFDEHFKNGIVNAVHEWITGKYCVKSELLLSLISMSLFFMYSVE